MKTLSILRHAKSSWDDPELRDVERPLLQKGVKRTIRVCKYMKKNSIIPDAIVTSPAERALQTTNIVLEELKLPIVPQVSRKLYPGRIEEILDVISELDDELKHVLIVGHNPVFSNLIDKMAEDLNVDWLPTSGLVTISFDIKGWEYIASATGNYIHYVKPKELK